LKVVYLGGRCRKPAQAKVSETISEKKGGMAQGAGDKHEVLSSTLSTAKKKKKKTKNKKNTQKPKKLLWRIECVET
jgi:hypothetical protein